MLRGWLVMALMLVPATAVAAPLACPYPATSDPAPFDRSDVIDDRVTSTDATQTGRLAVTATANAPTCAAPDAVPGIIDATEQFHYKTYVFHNYVDASSCVSVTVYHAAMGQPLQVAAYAPSFDPTSLTANYLAAVHDDALSTYHFAFTIAPNSDFEVVVNNASVADDSGAYQLLVGGCGEPGGAVDAGTPDLSGVVTSVSGNDPAPTTGGAGGANANANASATGGHKNGALPANEAFGDCSSTHGSPHDALFIALAVAFVSRLRRRRRS